MLLYGNYAGIRQLAPGKALRGDIPRRGEIHGEMVGKNEHTIRGDGAKAGLEHEGQLQVPVPEGCRQGRREQARADPQDDGCGGGDTGCNYVEERSLCLFHHT